VACQLHSTSLAERPAIAGTLRRCSTSVPISTRVRHSVIRAMIRNRTAMPLASAEYVRQSRIDPTPKPYRHSFQKCSTKAALVSSRLWQAQTFQTHRITLREDGAELRIARRACLRVHLDQIRPHDLEYWNYACCAPAGNLPCTVRIGVKGDPARITHHKRTFSWLCRWSQKCKKRK
jgi:hypothetical protein